MEGSKPLGSKSQGKLNMVTPGDQQKSELSLPTSSSTRLFPNSSSVEERVNSSSLQQLVSFSDIFLVACDFWKHPLSQVKTDFVQTDACFYILHSGKKYEYGWVEEGAIQRWEVKSVQTLVEEQLGLKLEANWELQAAEMGSPNKFCCIIKYSLKIFWQEALTNFSHILD